MGNPILIFKEQQKKLANKIRSDEGSDYDSYLFRHAHIAYCELRGRTRDQIENPRENNKPSESLIKTHKKDWKEKIEAWRAEI